MRHCSANLPARGALRGQLTPEGQRPLLAPPEDHAEPLEPGFASDELAPHAVVVGAPMQATARG